MAVRRRQATRRVTENVADEDKLAELKTLGQQSHVDVALGVVMRSMLNSGPDALTAARIYLQYEKDKTGELDREQLAAIFTPEPDDPD